MQTRYIVPLTLGLLVLLLGRAMYKALQPDAGHIRFQVRGDTAYVRGHTDTETFAAISNLSKTHPEVRRLELLYMSGTRDSQSNIKLARQIRAAGYATHLPKGARIASGAVDLFLAGTQRTMECGAMIGVHAWGDAYGRTGQDPGDPFEAYHRNFLSEMGITPDFYNFTRAAADHEDIHWMNFEQIKKYNLLTSYPDCGKGFTNSLNP